MRTALMAVLCLTLLPSLGAAQDVVVMSLGGDAPAETAREAREAVAAALAADELEVMPEGDLALRIPPTRLAECASSRCAWTIARELGVGMVAAVATWMTEGAPSSITVSLILGESRAYAATEAVGEAGLTGAARAAVTAAQAARGRALIIEGSSAPDTDVETPDVPELDESEQGDAPDVLHAERPLEEWILPSILGVVGLGLVGVSVYAMLDRQCERTGASGVCLRGTDPNYGFGVVTSILGGLSLVGAFVWLIVGGTPSSQGDIEQGVVMTPSGAAVAF